MKKFFVAFLFFVLLSGSFLFSKQAARVSEPLALIISGIGMIALSGILKTETQEKSDHDPGRISGPVFTAGSHYHTSWPPNGKGINASDGQNNDQGLIFADSQGKL